MGPTIFHDFEIALSNLEATLGYSEKKDHELAALISDAQIYCFQRCVTTLEALFESLANDSELKDELKNLTHREKILFMMGAFTRGGVLTQEQFQAFDAIFCFNSYLSLHPAEFESEDEIAVYNEGVRKIADSYHEMNGFLSNIYARAEETEEEHQDDCACN